MVQEIEVISSLMKETYDKDISVFGESFLLRTLQQRRSVTMADDFDAYYDYLKNNPCEADVLYSALLINYSRFFRETLTYSMLETIVLPSIIEEKAEGSEIRIWSTGCSRGQEAYSIAILLNELAEETNKKIRFRIFATDISQQAVEDARIGLYDFDSMQNLRLKYLEKYFTKAGNKYTVTSKLKSNVYFSFYDVLNLETVHPPESIFGDFDLVVCSNLLIYYKPDLQQAIIHRLKESLAPSGYLVTGEAERMLVEENEKLQQVSVITPIFRNKQRRRFQ